MFVWNNCVVNCELCRLFSLCLDFDFKKSVEGYLNLGASYSPVKLTQCVKLRSEVSYCMSLTVLMQHKLQVCPVNPV